MELQFAAVQKQFNDGVTKDQSEQFLQRLQNFMDELNQAITRERSKVRRKKLVLYLSGVSLYYARIRKTFYQETVESFEFINGESAFEENMQVALLVNKSHTDLKDFLNDVRARVVNFLENNKLKTMKVFAILNTIFTIKDEVEIFFTRKQHPFLNRQIKRSGTMRKSAKFC